MMQGPSLANFLTKLFGSRNQRLLGRYQRAVAAANAFESRLESLSDAQLRNKTAEFEHRLADGAGLDDLLPEAFAVVREASRRTLKLRHFDEQLLGGIALHQGKISEMRTGEGKTLVATMPAYLNALTGNGVHIVTVNEYLAQRDAEWMRPIYEFLGMRVGVIKSGQTQVEKRGIYEADIVFGTNNEFGFDYLRDNLALHPDDQAQGRLSFAIVDEVDSILIDEARTPLIISGPSEESTELYVRINKLLPRLKQRELEGAPRNSDITASTVDVTDQDGKKLGPMPIQKALDLAFAADQDLVEVDPGSKPPACSVRPPGDFSIDEKSKQAFLTEEGHQKIEQLLIAEAMIGENESLYDAGNIRLMHHVTAALRAHALFKKDVDYIIKDGEIVIVDEFTGRTMPGRRWSDGLHQAIEAKEGVVVKEENQTVASITFQNYFRMYEKLAGMTGTADTEAFEFQQIYGLEVVVVPTHMPMVRDDYADLVYLTEKDKFAAIIEDIEDCKERQQPVLVGTTSIETSEYLSGLLKKQGSKHQVLNAKHHQSEAKIVAEAGRPGAVTIATNMAGRGTDIVLGGNLDAELTELPESTTEQGIEQHHADWSKRHKQVIKSGGLRIIGTERHESRRIDNQLRGRSGRQGDPGSSRFYLSMEDNLMRIFGNPERTKSMLSRVGMREGEAIESNLLSRQIERAQRKVEAHNFDARKALLEYDDVANDQRRVIYQQRNELMNADDIADAIAGIRDEVVNVTIDDYIPPESLEEQWDVAGLEQALAREFAATLEISDWLDDEAGLDQESLRTRVVDEIEQQYDEKIRSVAETAMRQIEKSVMLQQLDIHWKEHLAALDYLRQGIHLRGYAQKNPKQEYKREAFEMFGDMLDQVKQQVISILSIARLRGAADVAAVEQQRRGTERMQFRHAVAPSAMAAPAPALAAAGGSVGQGAAPQAPEPVAPYVRSERKVGRNEPCPCGSGKKFKHCHGRLD